MGLFYLKGYGVLKQNEFLYNYNTKNYKKKIVKMNDRKGKEGMVKKYMFKTIFEKT
jgi:hypothetical protein